MKGIDVPEGCEVIGAGLFAGSFVRFWRDVNGNEVTYRRSIAEPSAPPYSGRMIATLESMGVDTSAGKDHSVITHYGPNGITILTCANNPDGTIAIGPAAVEGVDVQIEGTA